jgi:hypothetical protein
MRRGDVVVVAAAGQLIGRLDPDQIARLNIALAVVMGLAE